MAASAAISATPVDARRLAAEIFVLGFPMFLMDGVRGAHPLAACRFHRIAESGGGLAPGLVEPDPRVLQSSAVVDVSEGPAVLHLPDLRDRYFCLTLVDSVGEPFGSLGTRTRDHGSDVVLVGASWHGEVHRGFRARRAPSDIVWCVSRIVANSIADLPTVSALAARQFVRPARSLAVPPEPAQLASLDPVDVSLPQQVAALPPELLLHRLPALIARAPAETRDRVGAALADLAAALGGPDGIVQGSPGFRQAVQQGFADGLAQIMEAGREPCVVDDSGWSGLEAPEARGETPAARAARMLGRLGAPLRQDLLTLTCNTDESGRPLRSDERYRIHFRPGQLPAAEAEWRLAVLPQAPRGFIGGRSDLLLNSDESLDVIIQAEPPSAGRPVNWLQPSDGDFHLAMRLFWPSPAALAGQWRMPAVERLGSRLTRQPKPVQAAGSGRLP